MIVINFGGHLSLNGKPRATVQRVAAEGFGCMQIFASSPAAWKPPKMDIIASVDFVLAREQYGINPLIIHAIYLINLASDDPVLVQQSKSSLVATMDAAQSLGAYGVVTHIGSHGGRGFETVADQVAECLAEILDSSPAGVHLLLENSACSGGIIGAHLEELSDLIERSGRAPRLQVAIDTAHLFAAGWDFGQDGTVERMVEEIHSMIGLERLALVHANDSKQPCGSRKDRHANIGDGFIGIEGFRRIIQQPALRSVPWILETPNPDRRVEDLATLRALSVDTLPAEVLHAS